MRALGRALGFAIAISAALPLTLPSPASAEGREAYLERLRDVCSAECLDERDFIRAARKRDKNDTSDMAAGVFIVDVARWNDKYMLLTQFPPRLGLFGFRGAGSFTPTSYRPVLQPNAMVIELDEATFFDLLNVPVPGSEEAERAALDENGNIIVERDRDRKFSKPTLRKLRTAFRNRSIAVRGSVRLEIAFVGGRRDFRRKKVFLEVDNADDIVFLPRIDKDGQAILDGPLEGLRADYGYPARDAR